MIEISYPVISREAQIVISRLHNPIDADLLEDGVRRSSTREEKGRKNGSHIGTC